MIESSALSTSPWNTDFWKDGSTSFLGFEDLLDSEMCMSLPSELITAEGESSALERPAGVASLGQMDTGFACWEDIEDLFKKDTSTACDLDLVDEWSLDVTESSVLSDWSGSAGPTTFEGVDGHCSRPRSRRGPSPTPLNVEQTSSTRSWSSMTSGEQLRTVEALTEAISHELGLREQLDVIRIIDPTATIDPSADREFAVDLRHLDDHKLRQIADYVRRNSVKATKLAADKAEVTGESSRKRGRRRGSNSYPASGRSSPALKNAPVHKKETRKRPRQRPQQRRRRVVKTQLVKTQQDKAHEQMLKEQRSGLFVREQVLTLTSTTASSSSAGNSSHPSIAGTDEEEEEVDILH